ncbi:MAG: ribonuclease R, partial [Sediminibacterium sp.]
MSKQKDKKKLKQKSKHSPELTLKGRLEVTRSGMGYVIVEGGDVLVRPGDFATALNGDTVRVKVVKENIRTGKKEGRILEVVTRKQTEFVGHLQLSTNHAFFVPDTDKPMPDLFIPLISINGAKHKDLSLI